MKSRRYTSEVRMDEQSYLTTKINPTNVILSEGKKTERHILFDFIFITVVIWVCPALNYSILYRAAAFRLCLALSDCIL
jgi:hypothetical protein